MVHSFDLVRNGCGSTTIKFLEDSKVRQIIFAKNTKALELFNELLETIERCSYNTGDNLYKAVINELRIEGYTFIKNENNRSIFRPIKK